jgi:putative ABC transport system permease protein
MGRVAKLLGAVGVGLRGLRYRPGRTTLAVVGVTLAVVLVVMLGGLGYGLTTTGDEAIGWIDRELWASSGPTAFAPGAVGGVENPIEDSHEVAMRMERVEGVSQAQALAFQSVYVSPDGEDFDTVVGVGGTGNGSTLVMRRGQSFSSSDVHYANGTYNGPMTHEVIVGPRLADRYNLSVNDTLHVGGTLASAREHEFRVIGVSNGFSQFLGTQTVALHLSELQTVSGTTGNDRASLIAISTKPDADVPVVKRRLERRFPDFDIRTNDEQVGAVIGDQGPILASATTLVVLAVISGTALILNVLSLLVAQQRNQFAALKAAGVSGRLLIVATLTQGLAVGLLGGTIGVSVVFPITQGVNRIVGDLTGFPNLIKIPLWLLGMGIVLAAVMGVLGSTAAGWRVSRLSPMAHLRR